MRCSNNHLSVSCHIDRCHRQPWLPCCRRRPPVLVCAALFAGSCGRRRRVCQRSSLLPCRLERVQRCLLPARLRLPLVDRERGSLCRAAGGRPSRLDPLQRGKHVHLESGDGQRRVTPQLPHRLHSRSGLRRWRHVPLVGRQLSRLHQLGSRSARRRPEPTPWETWRSTSTGSGTMCIIQSITSSTPSASSPVRKDQFVKTSS